MAEDPRLAHACARAGLTFVDPPAQVLRLAGDKRRARAAAEAVGIPVPRASAAIRDEGHAASEVKRLGLPVFVKAARGGGGRGMRLVCDPCDLRRALDDASGEAEAAFGDSTVYLEQGLVRARHIEVQVLAAAMGAWSTCMSATAHCSVVTRRSSKSRWRRASILPSATASAKTR
jgi:pyruvate carboxylase